MLLLWPLCLRWRGLDVRVCVMDRWLMVKARGVFEATEDEKSAYQQLQLYEVWSIVCFPDLLVLSRFQCRCRRRLASSIWSKGYATLSTALALARPAGCLFNTCCDQKPILRGRSLIAFFLCFLDPSASGAAAGRLAHLHKIAVHAPRRAGQRLLWVTSGSVLSDFSGRPDLVLALGGGWHALIVCVVVCRRVHFIGFVPWGEGDHLCLAKISPCLCGFAGLWIGLELSEPHRESLPIVEFASKAHLVTPLLSALCS